LLYKGARVEITDKKLFKYPGLKGNVEEQIVPGPNRKLIGIIPVKLLIYNALGDTVSDSHFSRWMRTKLGEPPVIFDQNYAVQSEGQIRGYLFSKGYFDSETDSKIDKKNRRVIVRYFITPETRYSLDTVEFPIVRDVFTAYLDTAGKSTLLKSGDGYDVDILRKERERISEFLRNKGYYYFNPDYLIYKVDSNTAANTVHVSVEVKPGIPVQAKQQYHIGQINMHVDHSIDDTHDHFDTIVFDSINIFYAENDLRHKILSRSVLMRPGNIYDHERYKSTVNKLMGLGIYKYVNIRFSEESEDSLSLRADIFMTRAVPKSLRVELNTVTKSNAYAGPGIIVSFRNKNSFRGAELLSLNLNGSFETQFIRNSEGGNTYEFGTDLQLVIPRFVSFFYDFNKILSKKYTPQTRFSVSYIYTYRTQYFRMNTFDLGFGYKWQESPTKRHEVQMISANYSRITNRTVQFDSLLAADALIRESFNERLNLSLKYSYIYTNQIYSDRRINNYFNFNAQFAGNQIDLLNRIFNQDYSKESVNNRFLGIAYAQYARLWVDYRIYLNLGEYRKLVNRWFIGAGVPYSNSRVLPYSVQFYSGGVNSVRAFQPRTLGPGSYSSPDAGNYLGQSGDVRFEVNLEYRFTFYGLIKGAVFLDAGNVWLIHGNAEKPGGEFHFNGFINELAVGSGYGLRIDARIFVLRFDLGFPLRTPVSQQWIIRDVNLLSWKWYLNNAVLGVAIGYPF